MHVGCEGFTSSGGSSGAADERWLAVAETPYTRLPVNTLTTSPTACFDPHSSPRLGRSRLGSSGWERCSSCRNTLTPHPTLLPASYLLAEPAEALWQHYNVSLQDQVHNQSQRVRAVRHGGCQARRCLCGSQRACLECTRINAVIRLHFKLV